MAEKKELEKKSLESGKPARNIRLSVVVAAIVAVTAALVIAAVLLSHGGREFYAEYPTGGEIVTVDVEKNPVATVKLSDGTSFDIELCYYAAPNTVADFIALAEAGQYNGMAFNQVKKGYNYVMLNNADGVYTPTYYIQRELGKDSGHPLSHTRGVVSMQPVRIGDDTVTGQFFVVTTDAAFLDKNFSAFGKISDEDMAIFDKIVAMEPNSDGMIENPISIKSVKVETYGVDFPKPVIIPIQKDAK